ncbi:hypothetical protein [Luteitalea sp. TBR-22]|uniref:hypothetical protein n=1 Tax=Luteitalea sp. TBR-22 TaxID=2802971 RepID=UPI001EF57A25|nr:hypothetical protein [Luteitalea sp. TBR-22]
MAIRHGGRLVARLASTLGEESMSTNRHTYIAAAAILWNLIGLIIFVLRVTIGPEQVAALAPADRAVFDATPAWLLVVFGVATVTGVIGAVGLWRRAPWAGPVLGLSLAAVLVQMVGMYAATPAWQASGPAGLVLPAVIIALGAAQWRYASTRA